MRAILPFKVTNANANIVAAFREFFPALRYARNLGDAEVHVYRGPGHHSNGIVGRFVGGHLTDEFRHLHVPDHA